MNTNAMILYDCLKNDEVPPYPVLIDFFGRNNVDDKENIMIILGSNR